MRTFTVIIFTLLTMGLWAQTPELVLDINAGAEDGSPSRFFAYGDRALFRAETEAEGRELWITDGTAAGTSLLADINTDLTSGQGNSDPNFFVEYDGRVFFRAEGGGLGDELWVTDGTAGGTQLVKDINPGAENGAPFDFVVYDSLLYFTATTEENSSELWVTDGTEEGTRQAVDINPAGTGNPLFKTVFNEEMYFTADNGTVGSALFASDGTPEGTRLVADINPQGNASPGQFYAYRDRLYFRATDGTTGRELWATDGTTEGTTQVADLVTGEDDGNPDDFFAVGGNLFFSGNSDDGEDQLLMLDIATGLVSSVLLNGEGVTNLDAVVPLVDTVAYVLLADTSDEEGSTDFIVISQLEETVDIELSDISEEGFGGADPDDLVWTGNTLYFTYTSDTSGRELAGVELVGGREVTRFGQIVGGPVGSSIDEPTLVGNRLIFEADDTVGGAELYAIDAQTAYVTLETGDGEVIMVGDTLDFGSVAVGESDTVRVVFRNTGNAFGQVIRLGGGETIGAISSNPEGFEGDELIPAASDSAAFVFVYAPTESGSFAETLTASVLTAGMPQTFSFVLTGESTTTSTVDRGLPARAVYPNPTSGNVRIELAAPLTDGRWRLTNMQGQVLRTGVWPSRRDVHDIYLGALVTGIYQIEVSSGDRRLTARVIRE